MCHIRPLLKYGSLPRPIVYYAESCTINVIMNNNTTTTTTATTTTTPSPKPRPRNAEGNSFHACLALTVLFNIYGRPPASWPTAIIFYC